MTQAVMNSDGMHTFPNDATKAEIADALKSDTNSISVNSFPDDATNQEIAESLKGPPQPNILQQGIQTVKNIGAGALKGTGNIVRGAMNLFGNKTPQEIQAQKAKEDSAVDASLGAEPDAPISNMVGGALPWLVGGVEKAGIEAPGLIAKGLESLPPWLSGATQIGKSAAINAVAGGVVNEGAGGDFKTGAEIGGGLGAGITTLGKTAGAIIPKAASMVSKAEPQTYRFAASPGGLDALQVAAKTAPERVQSLVRLAENPRELPSMKAAEKAVRTPEMAAGRIDIRPILQAFDDAKVSANEFGGNATVAQKVNDALESEKRAIGGNLFGHENGSVSFQRNERSPYNSNGSPQSVKPAMRSFTDSKSAAVGPATDVNGMTDYTAPATQLRELKTSIGKGIDWTKAENAPLKAKMKGIYSKIDDEITNAIEKTQGPEVAAQYQKDLADWSQKINDFKELGSRLGNIPSNRLNRADALLKQYDKQGNFDLLSRIDSHTGEGLVAHAKLRGMADQLGMKSQPSIAAAERTADLEYLPQHLRVNNISSPGVTVRSLQGANKLGRGNVVLPPWLQPQAAQ